MGTSTKPKFTFYSQPAPCKSWPGPQNGHGSPISGSLVAPLQCAVKGYSPSVPDAAEHLQLFCITLSSGKTLTEPVLPGERGLITPAQNRHFSRGLCVEVSRMCS